jgi:hypothetical protein
VIIANLSDDEIVEESANCEKYINIPTKNWDIEQVVEGL